MSLIRNVKGNVKYRLVQDCSRPAKTNNVDPFECKGNYSATWNSMKLVHWPLMDGLLHLVQRGGDWAGPQRAQAPPRLTVHPSTASAPIAESLRF